MYKVLVVDDELAICKGLSVLIEWETYGFEVSGYALNGLEALEKLKTGRCDLLVTDIRMPEIDGIELIRRVRKMQLKCRVIILSGYKDFEYARAAVEFGVKNYILKPVNKATLISTVEEIGKEIEEELKRQITERESNGIIKENIMKQLLTPGIDNSVACKRAKEAGIDLDFACFRFCILETVRLEEDGKSGAKFIIKNIAEEIVNKYSVGHVFELDIGRIGILLCIRDQACDTVKEVIRELFDCVVKFAGESVTASVGDRVTGIKDIPESYRSASRSMEWKSSYGDGRLIFCDEVMTNKTVEGVIKYVKEHYFEEINLISISRKYYMNPAYLGRLFRSAAGVGFSDFVNGCRVEYAVRMLENDDLMVYEISEKVGYKDINYFYKVFKNKLGVTPSEYRAVCQKSKSV